MRIPNPPSPELRQVLAITYGRWDLAPGLNFPNHPDGRGQPPYILQVKLDPLQTDRWGRDSARRVAGN